MEKIEQIKEIIIKEIELKNYSNLHVLFGELINEVVNKFDVEENLGNIFLFINDLLNLNNEFIDEVIGTSFFIDLWEEFKNDKKIIFLIKSKLNKKGLLLFRENIVRWEDFENPAHND